MKRSLLLGLTLLLLAPVAAAQEPGAFSVSVDNASAMAFPPGETTDIAVDVQVGCDVILGAGGTELDVTLSTDLPDGWGASTDTVTVAAGPACVTGMDGTVTESGTISVTPTMDVLAYNATSFTITATAGDTSDTFAFPASWVAYKPGHQITTNVSFPYNFTNADGDAIEFTLSLRIDANSDTMVMIENIQTKGTLSGLGYQWYEPRKGDTERTKLLNLSWAPPAGDWESDNITFTVYSHCNTPEPCDADVDRTNTTTYTWQITNGRQGTPGPDGSDKGSPGLGSVLLLAGLVAAAFVARRR